MQRAAKRRRAQAVDSDRWYWRWLFIRLGAVTVPSVAYAISTESDIGNLKIAVGFFCVTLFILFMICHGELARRKPAPAWLTPWTTLPTTNCWT